MLNNSIEHYIKILLLKHDCVVLPGFGAFIANYHPATIHPVTHLFSPPSKAIAFNRSVQNDDGLLIHTIAGHEQLSYQEAKEYVSTYVIECKRTLDAGGMLLVHGIGKLVRDAAGNYKFIPDTSTNFLLEAYGLEQFRFAPVVRQRKPQPATQHDTPTRKEKPINWYAIAAMLAVMITIIHLIVLDITPNKLTLSQLGLLPDITPEIVIKNPDTENREAPLPEEIPGAFTGILRNLENTGKSTVDKDLLIIEDTNLNAGYYIITGAFSNERNARKEADLLRKYGYAQPVIFANEKGYQRVGFYAGMNRKAAEDVLNSIRSSYKPDSWMLKVHHR